MSNKNLKRCLETIIEAKLDELKKLKINNKERKRLLAIGEKYGYFSLKSLPRNYELVALFISMLQNGIQKPLMDVQCENGKIMTIEFKEKTIVDDYGQIWEFSKEPIIKYRQLNGLLKKYL